MKKLSKKVYRSNRAHSRLSYKHDKKQNEYPNSSKINFISLVKRNYHDDISKIQEETNEVLGSFIKKLMYQSCEEQRAYKNYCLNESRGTNRYVPKELQKKFSKGKKPVICYNGALRRNVGEIG